MSLFGGLKKGDAGKTNKGFRDLVTKYTSDEETKLRGGDLRYFDMTTRTCRRRS